MRTSKFFRFTIAGDKLNGDEIKGKSPLDSNVYYKDISIEKELGTKKCLLLKTQTDGYIPTKRLTKRNLRHFLPKIF